MYKGQTVAKSNVEDSVSQFEQTTFERDTVARALWYTDKGWAEIREEALGPPQSGQVRIDALCSALSRGTEALVQAGRVPPEEYERMRAPFMAGAFPFPVKYGYAIVGRIAGGAGGDNGRLAFALHPHQDRFNLAREHVHALPDGVTPERAVLAANMETALNAVWDAAPGPADRIAIVGAGVVGLLVGYLCSRLPGAVVTIVDIDPSRASVATALGLAFALPNDAQVDCDVVFHASGHASGLATAISLAGTEATVLEMSWYGEGDVAVPLGGAFHSKRLKLVSSQVGQISPSHRPRWTYNRRLAAALSLLTDPKLDALMSPAVRFEELPGRLPDIFAQKSGILCQLITY